MGIIQAQVIEVEQEQVGLRLDKALTQKFHGMSRSRWTALISSGQILLNGNEANQAKALILGDQIEIVEDIVVGVTLESLAKLNYESYLVPEIIFEDKDLLVLSKPEGLVVHAGSRVPAEQTLFAWLVANKKIELVADWAEELIQEQRLGIVHRLDKDTSGLMVVAKNPEIHEKLKAQFKNKTAKRTYLAVVESKFNKLFTEVPQSLAQFFTNHAEKSAIEIDSKLKEVQLAVNLTRHNRSRSKFMVNGDSGKFSLSKFRVLDSGEKATLLEVSLSTGRTHQIRVHVEFLGAPIVGDSIYGITEADRMLLHAKKLEFVHPQTDKQLEFKVAPPSSFVEVATKIGILICD